LRFFLKT